MRTYHVDEASFELPNLEVADRTVNVLELGGGAVPGLGLLVARSPFPVGKTLREVVGVHVEQERRSLRAWSLLFERDIEVEGQPAIELGTRWRGDSGMVYQRQAHIGLPDIVLLLVGNAPLEERATCDAYMDHVLWTLRLRAQG